MSYFTEASSNKKKVRGFTRIVGSIKELNSESAVLDTYNLKWKNDYDYIKSLLKACSKLQDYNKKVIYIPVDKWFRDNPDKIEKTKTPLGCICRYIKQNPAEFKKQFAGFIFIFYNSNDESFQLHVDLYNTKEYDTVINLLTILSTSHTTYHLTGKDNQKSPVKNVVNKKEEDKKNLEAKKEELVKTVADAVEQAETEEEAIEILNDDEDFTQLIAELEEEDNGHPKFNTSRTSRISRLNDEFMNKKVYGRQVKDIIDSNKESQEIPVDEHLKISSINEEWKEVRFTNFQNVYDIDADILSILHSFSSKTYPISVVDIKVENTSTRMDYVKTYTVQIEDGFGKRSTLVFDIPKFMNGRFMRLRGNDKVMSGQLMLLPCLKTDEDTVQCVSNYNKIFIYRHGLQGRSYPSSDKLVKSLYKMDKPKNFKIFFGDNKAICSKYELPIDYIDLASNINKIETATKVYYFNQDEYVNLKADYSKGIPYAVNKVDGSISYYKDDIQLLSNVIAMELCNENEDFADIYQSTKAANRLNYSEASILANRIPLIVILGYSLGLDEVLNKIGGGCTFKEKKIYDPNKEGYIRFSDGYLIYPINYSTSMLLNGLSVCPTESYSINDVNKRSMWLDFLEEFGGVILSDGLDNFADLFIDPITKEVCEHCKIPSDYFDMLIYANNLLADNKYNKHTDISGNRYRNNEIVAGYFYKAISKAYADYRIQVRRGRKVAMTMKRSAVIDAVMADPTFTDLSTLNPLLEMKSSSAVSFKGLSGMNGSRAYGLDKRTYDDSMINKLALSTSFSAGVGVDRQATIDMDVQGNRGYIKQSNSDELSVTKSLCMTEAVTPFGSTHDDPFRSAMTYIQTADHSMRTEKASPLLITNGADEAMPYMSSDTFAYKAKANGKVISINDEYMIIEYDRTLRTEEGIEYKREYINLKEEVKKNSSGGFFITVKLDTDLKADSKFKEGQIIAYDKSSYSNKNGEVDNLAYNVGTLAKIVIMNTDEGFEDSTAISSWLSEAMATDVVVESDKDFAKTTNVYDMVKIGQEVQQGDPLIIFQNSFDENEANILLKNITDPDYVSDLGRVRIKSKYTGVIQDIKIYRTCELDEMSDSLRKIVAEYEKKIKAQKEMYKKNCIPGANILDPDYKMQPTGIMKNNPDGVKIVFYIKYNDKLSVGDKIVAQSANKGIAKYIFPEGLEPFSEFRPEEKIHALFAVRSFNARMVTSVWTSGAINKCMVELDRKVKETMNIPWDPIEEL